MSRTPQPKYRKDYQSPHFFIDTVDLTIELHPTQTRVTNTMTIRSNELHPSAHLVLEGKEQSLHSVFINELLVSAKDYVLTDETLTLQAVPKSFTLKIVSTCNPSDNTSLMGLYLSGGNFCTQCEAEGFRKITYSMDRPDVLSIFTTKIIADEVAYPVLLSNGNLVEQGKLSGGRHYAVWKDPFKKPCYLFAMVAGYLSVIEDQFTTMTGRAVDLKIYANHQVISRCHYAMEALKKAMAWDEEVYGREYDLDIFMIVAVNDFNFGAMENKGLNIFNDKYILVDPRTATDSDYALIDAVVGHEYFHNWSGNRVTVRDWFQLCLKEGFTVFREQSFSESVGLLPMERITQVRRLRSYQFPEDAGPLSHPIRPDSYIEMGNFYTMTVYEKGAEVIRMLHTFLGKKRFREGTDLYFSRHDGQAVTCDDFLQAMQDASGVDLESFRRWYSQSGTPQVTIKTTYDKSSKTYTLHCEQMTPSTSGQSHKVALPIPIAVGLLDSHGKAMSLQLQGESASKTTTVLNFDKASESFTFVNVDEPPVPSLFRHFSAPIVLHYPYTQEQLAFLMAHDEDPVARWEAGQQLMVNVIQEMVNQYESSSSLKVSPLLIESIETLLKSADRDLAVSSLMLCLPDDEYLLEFFDPVNINALVAVKRYLLQFIAGSLRETLIDSYERYHEKSPYHYDTVSASIRAFKNACLQLVSHDPREDIWSLCWDQLTATDNMTDQWAAFSALVRAESPRRQEAIDFFYEQWSSDALVMDKWFMAQASSDVKDTVENVQKLLSHPGFNITNPNKVRALLGTFSRNVAHFHRADGAGYVLLVDQLLKLDKINSSVAARLASAFSHWRRFDAGRKALIHEQLNRMIDTVGLSKDLFEIVSKSLG